MVEAVTVTTLTLQIPSQLTERRFIQLCRANPELRLERSAHGELILMSPTGSETGARNTHLTGQLWWWNEQTGLGKVFDSSTGFHLPDGADRSPDAAWVSRERWAALSRRQRRSFAPLCPDFVVELRSPSDDLASLQAKMLEYLANGARLGWLIDTTARQVTVYRSGREPELYAAPKSLSGEEVLPGFVLQLGQIWND